MTPKTFVFDIKRYAIHDGPGIRTTIFLKGCPLRCIWCHNPESWLTIPQLTYKKNKCIGCGSCVETCPQNGLILTHEGIKSSTSECLLCNSCGDTCPTLAIEICGKEMSIDDLIGVIERERGVMQNGGGGVTVSGGEPLIHSKFLLELLKEIGKKGFHRAVDTTLHASPEIVEDVAKECELFLIDLKCMDSAVHKRYTGVSNDKILENIKLIANLNHPYYIRIPLIKEINASNENIEASAKFLAKLQRKPEAVELLPYHDIGKGKHERINSIYNPEKITMTAPSQQEIEDCISIFNSCGIVARLG